jgi:hypothetical protein
VFILDPGALMTQTSPPEATLVETEAGLKPDGEGWFVVNVSESVAIASEDAGHAWTFEDPAHKFPHFGINVHVLQPGEPACKYHAEEAQEGFLVLQGECVLVVSDEERSCGSGISSTPRRGLRMSSSGRAPARARC